jgi:chemotaxis protein CheX
MTALADAWNVIAEFEQNLDRAMEEVFDTMMGVHCAPAGDAAEAAGQTVSAVIGLAGAMTGTVVFHGPRAAALNICSRLTGVESPEVDATVRDALGEVGNMVAGAWKGYDPDLASRCLLTTPTVVVGERYEVFSRKAAIRFDRTYRFDEHICSVTVSCQRAG